MAWQFVADLADAVAARPWLPVAIGPMRLLLVPSFTELEWE